MEFNEQNLAEMGGSYHPENDYIVWIDNENSTADKVGKLENEKDDLTNSTPFNGAEIDITPEERGYLTYPKEIEISRTTFTQLKERLFNTVNTLMNQYNFSSSKDANR